MKLETIDIDNQRQALHKLAELTEKSVGDPLVREVALQIIRECKSRDDRCELEAIFQAVKHGDPAIKSLKKGFKYVADPVIMDYFVAPHASLKSCEAGACGGDCLPTDTKVLGEGYKVRDVGDVQAGDVIMGDGRWTKVLHKWDKGVQPVLALKLNNGSTLRCTPDHKVFIVPRRTNGCSGERSTAVETLAKNVREGDDLLTAQDLPPGTGRLDSDLAWLLGTYVADGWSEPQENRVCISGKDGHPKEAQKERVQEICDRFGLPHYWHERYIRIVDSELTKMMASCGAHAPEKHLPSLDLDQATATAVLEGLAADASVNKSLVYGTTSKELALQVRILFRILGQSTHIKCVEDHGGLGKNPIYRITVRQPAWTRNDNKEVRPHARVQSIQVCEAVPTVDIETDTSRFYLPESDLVVHNCDDHTSLIAALAATLGFTVGLRAWGSGKKGEDYVHVYAVVALPKRPPFREEVGLDTTVDDSTVGWEPRGGLTLTAWLE